MQIGRYTNKEMQIYQTEEIVSDKKWIRRYEIRDGQRCKKIGGDTTLIQIDRVRGKGEFRNRGIRERGKEKSVTERDTKKVIDTMTDIRIEEEERESRRRKYRQRKLYKREEK